jgi:hypothetical protein
MGLLSSEAFIHQRSGSLFFWLLRGTKQGEASNYEKVISFVYLPYTERESFTTFLCTLYRGFMSIRVQWSIPHRLDMKKIEGSCYGRRFMDSGNDRIFCSVDWVRALLRSSEVREQL